LAIEDLILGAVVLLFVLGILASSIRIVREYERAVMFRLGRLIGAKDPSSQFSDGLNGSPRGASRAEVSPSSAP
jgi:regulator of protease activity HflC (stomatin/prohibitin superfamily)